MRNPLTLSPSRAARRVACAGSHRLEAQYPGMESEAAREGTAAHWVAAEMLRGSATPDIGSFTPNGEIVTREMLDGAEIYYDDVRGVLEDTSNQILQGALDQYVHIEEEIPIANIHPDCKGTPDCWMFLTDSKELHLWDYKFGHTPVAPDRNWQLIEYAAGVLAIHENPKPEMVYFRIVQPRDYRSINKVKMCKISFEELLSYSDILRKVEAEAMEPGAICTPSPECNYCNARHACGALRNTALTIADAIMQNTPDNLNEEELGSELRYLEYAQERLNARITGVKEQVLSHLRSGKRIPFYQLEQNRPREQWMKPPGTIAKIGDLFGINLRKTPDVITPQQAIKAGVPEAIVKENSIRPIGKFKVESINMQKLEKLFST